MRDSFVFYRSFYEAIADLSQTQQTKLFIALCEYALNDKEPALTGAAAAVFKLIRPQIDANNRRYKNGCKHTGKDKKGGSLEEPNINQSVTETEPKTNLNETKQTPNDNDNVNDKDNDNDNDNGCGCDLWKQLGAKGIDQIYEAYPKSGGLLIQEVYEKAKNKEINNPVAYVLGYAKNVKWDDDSEHFDYPF